MEGENGTYLHRNKELGVRLNEWSGGADIERERENGLFQSVLVKQVVTEPNVKLECVPKFCYLGDTLGADGGADEAARARVRCAWAKFKELSPMLTACGASYHMKGTDF